MKERLSSCINPSPIRLTRAVAYVPSTPYRGKGAFTGLFIGWGCCDEDVGWAYVLLAPSPVTGDTRPIMYCRGRTNALFGSISVE